MEDAYWSRLTISFGAEGDLFRPPAVGPVNDGTDPQLARLLRIAVKPVVDSLLMDEELESLRLYLDADDPSEIWMQVVARGETFFDAVTYPVWEGHAEPYPAVIAARVADHLEDWICETRFAWGEQRTASYSLPTDAE